MSLNHTNQVPNPRGPQAVVNFNAGGLITDTNQASAAAEFPGAATDPLSLRQAVDLRAFNYARLSVYIGSVAPDEDAYLGVQYSLDGGSTWAFLNGLTLLNGGPAVGSQLALDSGTALATSTVATSPWVAIAALAKNENALLRLLSTRGDGVIDPVYGNITLQLSA